MLSSPALMYQLIKPELSSPEENRCQFNRSQAIIKLGIDVHEEFCVVVEQVGGTHPKPPQRFNQGGFLHRVAKLKSQGAQVHAICEAGEFGFGLQQSSVPCESSGFPTTRAACKKGYRGHGAPTGGLYRVKPNAEGELAARTAGWQARYLPTSRDALATKALLYQLFLQSRHLEQSACKTKGLQ